MTAPLTTNVEDFATRAGTELKAHKTLINGNAVDLSALTTTAKANLVDAINEVKNTADAAAGGGVAIDDAAVRADATYSSQKIEQVVEGVTVDLTDLIDDVTASTSTVFSSTRTQTEIDNRIETRLDVSTADLDTFREVADALADQDSAVAGINTALSARVRHDAAQTIADGGAQARANIGAAAAADVGDVAAFDPVATFEAGLV